VTPQRWSLAFLIAFGPLVSATCARAMNGEVLTSCQRLIDTVRVHGDRVEFYGLEASECWGYMEAVTDLLAMKGREAREGMCLPGTLTTSQLAGVFVGDGRAIR
jgi:hypothetical protein